MAKNKPIPNPEIGERIRRLMEKNPDLSTQPAIAKRTGIGQTTVGRILRGEVDPSADYMLRLADAFETTVEYLMRGSITVRKMFDMSKHPDLMAVQRVLFKLSAGVSGFAIEPEEGNGKPIFFRHDWFSMHSYRPEKLFAVRVSGASMEPSLWDGDLVVINTDDTTPNDGDVFAMNYEGEMVIKRLRRDAGEWWATSDNADQRRFAPKRCTEDVKLIGRVIYKQSERI